MSSARASLCIITNETIHSSNQNHIYIYILQAPEHNELPNIIQDTFNHSISNKNHPSYAAMTPQATSDATPTLLREPLKYSGALDQFRSFDYAPAIGTEYPDLQLTDILDDDAKLRDLAITG